jgi:tetratricopeptide (TPR) repeat protein
MRILNVSMGVASLVMAAGAISPASAAADDAQTCQTRSGDSAIVACSRVIALGRLHGSDLACEYYNRGLDYQIKHDRRRAIADYDTAIRLDPHFANAYNNRGLEYMQEAKYDRALADFNTAIRLDPKLKTSYLDRGNAYLNKGEYQRAIADYDSAIRIDPNYATAYYNRGLVERLVAAIKGKSGGGRADPAKARRLDPKVGSQKWSVEAAR